jgi:hypothetical protein
VHVGIMEPMELRGEGIVLRPASRESLVDQAGA